MKEEGGGLTLLGVEGWELVDQLPVVLGVCLDVTKGVVVSLEMPVQEKVVFNQA